MVGRFASGCLLGAWLRFAEGRYAAGGAGVSGATLWNTALVVSVSRCRAVPGSLAGMETLTLESDALSVVILVGKGADILSIVDLATGVDPLLRSPWGLRDPRHLLPVASPVAQWVQRYPGGWQELLPNFGAPCTHEGTEYTMHGEAAVMPWRAEIVVEDDDAVEALFEIELLLVPLRLERRVRLERGRRAVALEERLSNAGSVDVDFIWGHHPAIGAPFLSPACRLDVGARELAVDADYTSAFLPLEPGSRHAWEGRIREELSELPAAGVRRDLVAYFLGFEQGWWAVTNRQLGVGFGVAWDAAIFPFACFWQELRATDGFPWFGRGYALALEPTTSWPAAGIAEVVRTTGTQRSLAPGETIETELAAVIYDSDRGVERIEPGGDAIVTGRDGSGSDVASRLTTKTSDC